MGIGTFAGLYADAHSRSFRRGRRIDEGRVWVMRLRAGFTATLFTIRLAFGAIAHRSRATSLSSRRSRGWNALPESPSRTSRLWRNTGWAEAVSNRAPAS